MAGTNISAKRRVTSRTTVRRTTRGDATSNERSHPKEIAKTECKATSRSGAKVGAAAKGSKLDRVFTLLRRPDGVGITELCKATGWQAHSSRGAISGTIKERVGLIVISIKADGVRRYRESD